MKIQTIQCGDETCKHNRDGFCEARAISLSVDESASKKTVVVCDTYEDKREDE